MRTRLLGTKSDRSWGTPTSRVNINVESSTVRGTRTTTSSLTDGLRCFPVEQPLVRFNSSFIAIQIAFELMDSSHPITRYPADFVRVYILSPCLDDKRQNPLFPGRPKLLHCLAFAAVCMRQIFTQ